MGHLLIASRYQVLHKIGQGGMGEVFRVKHKFTGEVLALKVLKNELIQREEAEKERRKQKDGKPQASDEKKESQWATRFKREMQISAKIASEHVVRITDADVAPELGGSYFYVMDLLNGADLDRLLRDRGPFSAEETVWLVGQLAQGLDKAHSVGIVHRDMKPANLFLHVKPNGAPLVKVLDFGLAFLRADVPGQQQAEKLTDTGASLGTLNYFAPEQAMGERELIGPGTDIWAVGVIAFELLTGEAYFPGREPSILFKIAHAQLVDPSGRSKNLTTTFDHWFFQSCDKDPKKRWRTVAEQARELAKALGVDESIATSEAAPASLREWAAARPVAQDSSQLDVPIDVLAPTEQEPRAASTLRQATTAVTPAIVASGQAGLRSGVIIAAAILFVALVAVGTTLWVSRSPRTAAEISRTSDGQPANTGAQPSSERATPPSNVQPPAQAAVANPGPPNAASSPASQNKPKPKRGSSGGKPTGSSGGGEFKPRAP